jgi:hypothetical protein
MNVFISLLIATTLALQHTQFHHFPALLSRRWPAPLPLPNIKKKLPLGGLQSAQLLPKKFNVGTFSTTKKRGWQQHPQTEVKNLI